jgi:hypothetical protein
MFEIQQSHIHKIHSQAKTMSAALDRPLAIDSDEANAIMCLVDGGHANGNFVTLREVLNFVEADAT